MNDCENYKELIEWHEELKKQWPPLPPSPRIYRADGSPIKNIVEEWY